MPRKLAIIAGATLLGLVGVVVIAFFMFRGTEYTITLDEDQLQAAIDKKLPYEKKFAFIFLLSVRSTEVSLIEGTDRIGAVTDLDLNIKLGDNPKNLGGSIQSETGIRYDQEQFCFYLLSPEIQEVKIEGVPEKYTKPVSSGTKKIMQAYITDVPVYRIKDDTLKMQLAKAVLKKAAVRNGKLELTLGY